MNPFEQIEKIRNEQGAAAALEQLVATLREQKEWHNLFDARMLQKKHALGLPLSRPTSLQDVPEVHRKSIEETYLLAAREAGEGFLADGDILNAWMYFKVVREPEKVAQALNELPDEISDYQQLDRMVQIALHQGVNPAKGVRWMINGHGLCSTITALDQTLPELTQPQRVECAKIMVRELYNELRESVQRHVEQRIPMLPPNQSLEKLIAGRDWLFENGSYHADVSHLASIIRFARSIESPAEELEMALQLAQYGTKLDKSLQYAGDPPFGDVYPAHVHFFHVLLNRQRDAGLKYFRSQLEAEPDAQDKPIYAYVLVDLLVRCGQLEEAVKVAEVHLNNLGEEVSVSFDELCTDAGRLDVLKKVRREQGNLVGFTAAVVREASAS
ncbi:hypothetical protein SH661x_003804 [Planctomicrobium sp. SH661]|uniref:hypothetical protein n=1 Tax=Planctomicrobium sp. SH661 TaxID=3448124 RepID=UPI003F5C3E59